MKCTNHKKKESTGTCTGCGNPFCADCMMKVGRKNICKECASEQLQENNKSNSSENPQNIVITQQVTNQQSTDTRKPKGSVGWLIFWILICWPVAIIYALIRRWK